jgi:hypothetical protein
MEKRRKMDIGEGHAYRWSRATMPELKMPSIGEEPDEDSRRATAAGEEGVEDATATQSNAAIDGLRSTVERKLVWTGKTLVGTDVE